MAKKRSFFERLAGNLRFDDDEDDVGAPLPLRKKELSYEPEVHSEPKKDSFSIEKGEDDEDDKPAFGLHPKEEEIGELPVDVYETQNEVIIQTLIAGVLPENLSINVTRERVSITGKREENRSVTKDQYHIQELYWGSFGRTIHLPAEVEIDAAEAIERHGMLMVKLPKIDKQRKTILKIKSI
ncbi:Hsp20/alpha crystallin family protein [Candidatus Nomurabacteria bacterium]|nr:Hsp20/alpha crystallin family protein [Candidatus Nomurabacteria bacterium]